MRNFVRFCLRAFFRLMKVKFETEFDIRKLPKRGVYVSNHVSFLDPILLFAFLPGNPVFALNGHLYRRALIRFLMKTAKVVQFNPIEPADIKNLIAEVDKGQLCVIFAEGRITENGGLMKIYEAPGLVADKSKSPIIPIWIDGPQYGYFSKTKGKLPHRPLPKIRVILGKPRPFKLKDDLRRQRDHISNEVYMILREMCFNANGVQIRVTGEIEVSTDEVLRQEIFGHPTRKFLQAWKEKGIDDLLTVLIMKNCEAVTWTMETNFEPKKAISICNG